MSSRNIEMKSLPPSQPSLPSQPPLQSLPSLPSHTTTKSQSNTQTYDVKEESNSKIRYLMSYYGY
jgi:hypothetical protein